MEVLCGVYPIESWILVNWCFTIHYSLCETLIKPNQVDEIYAGFTILLLVFNFDRDKIMTCFLLIY